MKELDKSKVYDLSDLTINEKNQLITYLKKKYYNWNKSKEFRTGNTLYYDNDTWYQNQFNKATHNAKELFEPTIPTLEEFKEKCETANELLNESIVAYKETSNKLPYELDFNFITQLAERMNANKGKYEPYNWQKLDNIEDLKQALFRHVLEVMKGNYQDDNRLFGHLEAIALNAMFINYQLNKK